MIRVIDHTVLHEEQKKLLAEKGGDLQRDFLKAALENDKFSKLISGWKFIDGEDPAVPDKDWTEGEFLHTPYGTEEIIANTWKGLRFREAARSGTWFSIHLEMINKGKIESSYLAGSSGGTDNCGANRIGLARQSNDPDEVDKRVRDILRRMGGVTERGARTVYQNCPTARAWWRHQYSKEAHELFSDSEGTVKDLQNLSNKLGGSKAFWEVLTDSMVSSLTVIGESGIRSSLIYLLHQLGDQWHLKESKQMKKFIQKIGNRAAVQALGALEPQKVFEIIENEIYPQVSGNEAQ